MKIRLIDNRKTTSKDWIYLLPGIALAEKHLIFYWINLIIDIQFKE